MSSKERSRRARERIDLGEGGDECTEQWAQIHVISEEKTRKIKVEGGPVQW